MSFLKYEMSKKGKELIDLYLIMAENGYIDITNVEVTNPFSQMEIKKPKHEIKELFVSRNIKSLLDYGCGGSDYDKKGFNEQQTAKEFFNLDTVRCYEPARNIDERIKSDTVVCFDVLEHIYLLDIGSFIRELFDLANKLVIVNIACYKARALLPNGENAHITVRDPLWWKGVFDIIALEYPNIEYQLIVSRSYDLMEFFKPQKMSKYENSKTFETYLQQ